ncbi:methyltransferase domain-containing protein [Azospirillum halopraeferens]|uniref:methyltransferase domain-containing protein n=1 Tax=Azospirillum halopraeferens TaxID=34010 RepID=UPI0004112028|nr:methyltransferase domain-containing protein [Azospirillum halopraeferens]
MAFLDLPRRRLVPELMDTLPVDYAEFRTCLRHLEAINRATGAYRPTLRWLDRVAARHGAERPLRVLDAGAGHGDMLRRIAARAARRGVAVELTGVDRNPWSARAAREAAPDGPPIRWLTADLFALPEEERPDVIISSLFAHHLDDAQVVAFLRWMEGRARLGWFINDLHRHAVPLAAVRAAVAVLPVSRLVVHDAPVSVARAFTRADWLRLLAEAGLEGVARVEWFAPFRLCVGRIR